MTLQEVRDEIDQIDREIIALILKRTRLAEKVLMEKRSEDQPVNDEAQNQIVLKRAAEYATELNLDAGEVKNIFKILIKMNIEKQKE
ncbi:MAG: chorismate mutase, partial [Methanosarcinales archaeon]